MIPTATAVLPVHVARHQLTAALLRLLAAEHGDESHAHHADTIDYHANELSHAARDLTRTLDAAPTEQPPGWKQGSVGV